MAKNPAVPHGVSSGSLTKDAGYGHYGSEPNELGNTSVREPGRPNREPRQGSQRIPRSPVQPMMREWASASYDPSTGRAARVADDPYAHGNRRNTGPERWKQIPDAGSHTAPNNTKGRSRPGRW